MSAELEIIEDLKKFPPEKLKKMYSDEMTAIMNLYGGKFSDIPANSDHDYWKLQNKLALLNKIKG